MLFEYDLSIATANTADNKAIQTVLLDYGIIHHISITFPAGCGGLIHATVASGLNQIFPANASGTIKGDNISVEGDVFISMQTEPYEVTLSGYTDGTDFDHNLTFRFWVKRLWQLNPFSDQFFKLTSENDESIGI